MGVHRGGSYCCGVVVVQIVRLSMHTSPVHEPARVTPVTVWQHDENATIGVCESAARTVADAGVYHRSAPSGKDGVKGLYHLRGWAMPDLQDLR